MGSSSAEQKIWWVRSKKPKLAQQQIYLPSGYGLWRYNFEDQTLWKEVIQHIWSRGAMVFRRSDRNKWSYEYGGL